MTAPTPNTPTAPTAAEREGAEPAWWVDDETFAALRDAGVTNLYEGTDRSGPYRTGWTKAELRLATALLAARRENEELRKTLDLLYVDRYGITYQELERRIRDVQAGKAIPHEEARARILAALAATQEEK